LTAAHAPEVHAPAALFVARAQKR